MIPVTLQAEPADFNTKVRQKGWAWLAKNKIAPNGPAPKGTQFRAYWSHSNPQLWAAYSGVCAYLAIYVEWPTGANSTDHFVPKSKHAGWAYEWSNYRLSCLAPNRDKNNYTDVLDPIGLAANTFVLNLGDGQIKPNPALVGPQKVAAAKTIERLKLDSPCHKAMRARHFAQYIEHKHAAILKQQSPFVWYEADRQGLL